MVAQSSDTSDLSPSSQDSSPHPGATPESEWSNGAVTQTGELVGPTTPTGVADIPLDLQADSQVFDPQRQIITARGNVRLRVGNAILNAERLWVNLINRFVLAEGNVRFLRGDQLIEGDRLEYNLLQGTGQVDQASGTLFIPTTGDDFANILPRSS
jgi:lipopolysaccharide assembly outer membrane protein LptD (OstA)